MPVRSAGSTRAATANGRSRCAADVVADGRVTAYAGCGIVAGSEPQRELAETRLKFRPIVDAFA